MTTTAASVDLQTLGRTAKQAARRLATLGTDVKNRALLAIADALVAKQDEILRANQHDMQASKDAGVTGYILDRLLLTPDRIAQYAADVRNVAALPDPIGQGFEQRRLANGLVAGKVRVPLGVILCIYEARPNVTIDTATLCLKAGNATVLRGGKEAFHSNSTIARIIGRAASEAGVPDGAIQFVESTDRALVPELLSLRQYIDLVVPRGGGLIDVVLEHAKMPVLIGGVGVCHTYVDASADLSKAVDVVDNAKTRRPSICNALDTLLVHRDVAVQYLPLIGKRWAEKGVEMRCDQLTLDILSRAQIANLIVNAAEPDDFGKEHLALVATVKVVDSLDEALDLIYQYGTGHSDAIITENYSNARRFVQEVDTAVVYVNASTQFTDGAQFGLGAEIIDSTQKMHARGPVGLQEITTYKWVVFGDGQTRPA
jgi:glutamate-5-semialdehyde dehydrogenase